MSTTASISGTVFKDLDGDGSLDGGEAGIAAVNVTLSDSAGHTVATTTSDANGAYTFGGVAPGSYFLSIVPPSGNLAEGPARIPVSLGATPITDQNLGFYAPQPVAGTVTGPNGTPIDNAVVKLFDEQGNVVATTTSFLYGLPHGVFDFTSVKPGTYTIQAFDPSSNPLSSPISTTVRDQADYGLSVPADPAKLSSVSGTASFGGAALAGVNVMVVAGAGTPTASVVQSTTTDASGHYSFAGLLPSTDYSVVFATPEGDVATSATTVDVGALAPGQSGTANVGFGTDPSSPATPAALPPQTTINIIVRGQSNATYFTTEGYLAKLQQQIEQMLGFDGVNQKINLVADAYSPDNVNTLNPGTGMIEDWLYAIGGDYRNGWNGKALETGLLTDIERKSALLKQGQTMILWLHNESDSEVPGLTPDEWESAARYETGLIRGALGESAAQVPLLLVNAIPFLYSNSVYPSLPLTQVAHDASEQNIRVGMAALAADPAFNAQIVAQSSDVTMDHDGTINGPHLDAADDNQLVSRLALSIAKSLAASALPGSSVYQDQGQFDSKGPQVVGAAVVGANQLLLTVLHDHAAGFETLSAAAAAGVGWSIRNNAGGSDTTLLASATSARIIDGTHLLVTFDNPVPTNGKLFYAWGGDRLAANTSLPGNGNAVYDTNNLPIFADANGVAVTTPTGAANISGTIFLDFDRDNVVGASDIAIPASAAPVTVTLSDLAGHQVAQTTQDQNGAYSFTGVAAGVYQVTFSPIQGFFADTPTPTIVTVNGQNVTANDGISLPGAIVGTVFADVNANGTADLGEGGIDGVTVNLVDDATGQVVATTTTVAVQTTDGAGHPQTLDGIYTFTGLAPGQYSVQFTAPAGQTFTTPAKVDVTPAATGQASTVNAGLRATRPGGISGTVFNDANADGTQATGEAGLAGATVTLTDTSGHTLATTQTDAHGAYTFSDLAPGTYGVSVAKLNGQLPEAAQSVTVGTAPVTGQNLGLVTPQSIAGFVFAADGTTPVDGIVVSLYDAQGHLVATATSAPNFAFPHGVYEFDNLLPGTYTLQAMDPSSTAQSKPLATTVHGGSPDYGQSLTLLPARNGTASLSGSAFVDNNGDKAFEAGTDVVFPGIVVALIDQAGNFVASTTTAPDGSYAFAKLASGSYTVVFGTPPGFVVESGATRPVTVGTTAVSGVNAAYAPSITVSGVAYNDANANGVPDTGEGGLNGVTVKLVSDATGETVATTTTSPVQGQDGHYAFTGIALGAYTVQFAAPSGKTLTTPASVDLGQIAAGQTIVANVGIGAAGSGSISGTVFADANADGVLGAGEAGIAGAVVTLLDASGTVIGSTTTNSAGQYTFSALAAGSYGVSVATPTNTTPDHAGATSVTVGTTAVTGQNIGYFTPSSIAGFVQGPDGTPIDGIGVNLVDSSGTIVANTTSGPNPFFPHGVYEFDNVRPGSYTVQPVVGSASPVTTHVSSGVNNFGVTLTVPASSGNTATITGFAFEDTNNNGVFDPGEALVDGETVQLLNGDRDPIATTTTGPVASMGASGGAYTFANVAPGSYTLRFTAPNGQVLTTPVLDSLGTLSAGQTINVDSGLASSAGSVTINGKAFADTNGNGSPDSGEAGLAGVSVLVVKDAGTPTALAIKTTVTDSDGSYTFSALPAGNYSVVFATPTGFVNPAPAPVALGSLLTGQAATANAGFEAAPPPTSTSQAPTKVVNIIVRGQSNAQNFAGLNSILFDNPTAIATLQTDIEKLLGFDGINQKVNLFADAGQSNGVNTINSGTAFIGQWVSPVGGDYHNGWTANNLELGFLSDVSEHAQELKSGPTAVVWLHNETDVSVNTSLTTDEWTSAVKYEAGLIRGVLGESASAVPYIFVNGLPFPGSNQTEQNIRIGMGQLASDPSFDGRIGAQISDINDDEFGAGFFGGHIDNADRQLLAFRLAQSLAQTFASSAMPGSPVALANGQIDDLGPQVISATAVAGHANQLLLTVKQDGATGFGTLSSAAAQGVGWSLRNDASGADSILLASGTAAQIVDGTHLLVTFDKAVDATGKLFYGWGSGLLSLPGQGGFGNAIYDNNHDLGGANEGMPIWVDPNGLAIGSPPVVTGVVASGAGIADGNGRVSVGATILVTTTFSAPVIVDTTRGVPTLTLSDGEIATYVSGSGTSQLVFKTTVASGDNSSHLAVTGFNLNQASVVDAGGNAAALTGAVSNLSGTLVIDTTAPVIGVTAPGSIVAATSAVGAVVSFAGSATDAADGTDTVVFREGANLVTSGQTFAIGTHTISASATDAAGNAATPVSFTFTVADQSAPVVTASGPAAAVAATSAAGAAVSFTGAVSDLVDGSTDAITYTEQLAGGATKIVHSGDTFAIGTHVVVASAKDSQGLSGTAAPFTFTVAQPLSGVAEDGYIAGATVFADANGNGRLDPGEASTTTDSQGAFTLLGGSGPLVLAGGTDIATGLPFGGTLEAPAGATIVSPLTTIVQIVAQTKGMSTAAANASVVAALGLPTGTDLATLDAQAGASAGNSTAATVFAAQTQAANAFDLITAAGGTLTTTAAQAAIASAFTTPSSVLTNGAALAALAMATGVTSAAASAVGSIGSSANALIAAATASGASAQAIVGSIAATAKVAQGAAAESLTQAVGDPAKLAAAATSYSGSNLAQASADAGSVLSTQYLFGSVTHDVSTAAGEVYAFYETILGRAPDPVGLEDWVAALQGGAPLARVAQGFLDSPEYAARYGSTVQSDAAFVTQLYEDGLHRVPEAGGLQVWEAALAGGISRAQVAVGIATSAESQKDLAPTFAAGVFVPDASDAAVARLYYGLLGRAPEVGGLQNWETASAGGLSINQVAQGFLLSPEYQASAPGQALSAYVTGLYQSALGRSPEASGLQTWVGALQTGTLGIAGIADGVLGSSEFQADEAGRSDAAYIDAVYEAALGRHAESGGLQTWETALSGGLTRVQVAQDIVGSQEFAHNVTAPAAAAFVNAIYEGVFGRGASAGEMQTWQGALSGGTTPAGVAVGIAESAQAAVHLAPKIEAGFHVA